MISFYFLFKSITEKFINPHFGFRAIKFNLPWSPYRAVEATEFHIDVCRDLTFWQQFLDMMARNRFNVLSLWNLHPFTYMIRPKNYPDACPFSEQEMIEWNHFWKTLFRMAKDRGIETYIVNWNIVVSPEFAKTYHVKEKNDTSDLVKQYTKECVTQVIDEYKDLTGLGVTLADWMNNMTSKEREDWIEDTFVAGMKEANRPVKFIHRSVLAGSPIEMRRVIDNADLPDPVWVEVKFNWSHGHSTPKLALTHDYSSGKIDDRFWNPKPANYKIIWMIRNEDFFILRWGDPTFIRDHIKTNDEDYVGGYFIGSEGYIPALDYSHTLSPHKTWHYAFEKQWLFYTLWGRLLYNPDLSDRIFTNQFDQKYGRDCGEMMLKAYSLASRMPLRLASFYAATWDYTLYSEGFLAPRPTPQGLFDKKSSFISIEELIQHRTLDPAYLSIPDYVKRVLNHEEIQKVYTTPLEIADEMDTNGKTVLDLVSNLRLKVNEFSGTFECELEDLEAWGYLSLYFGAKLKAGVEVEMFRSTKQLAEKEKAISHLEEGLNYWKNLVRVTQSHYREVPYLSGEIFSWSKFTKDVEEDIEYVKSL